tara:strand:+ start:122 stop:943 length:822 start_codon:yes stop_codon:yes gene_type:complete
MNYKELFENKIKNLFFRRKPKENIIFLHLPKAGGTTLRQIFYKQYSHLKSNEIFTVNRTKETYKFLDLSDDEKNKIKLLVGHFPFGLHKSMNEYKTYKYISFLRNPINRTVSAYNYAKTTKGHDYFKKINENKMSLEDYVDELSLPWLNNGQTKFIAGMQDFKIDCTEEIFKIAIKNITQHFLYVGLLEKYDESLLILKNELSLQTPYYSRKNETKTIKNEIGEDEKTKITQHNIFDIRLYEYVLKLHIEKKEKINFFDLKLNLFKLINSIYG